MSDARTGVGLWLRWVLANAIGEALGLGGTALVGVAAASRAGEGSTPYATAFLAALAILAGTLIEGSAVGTDHWAVLLVRPARRLAGKGR